MRDFICLEVSKLVTSIIPTTTLLSRCFCSECCCVHLASVDSHLKSGHLSSVTVAQWKRKMEKCPSFTCVSLQSSWTKKELVTLRDGESRKRT